jgi:hypothetical protein
MNLNKLPVLIRTEVTTADARGVNLPAVYSRALVVLEEAVEELSFSKLKAVEVSVEGLAAWAKATQDTTLTKQARELKFRARRTAFYIAEKLVAQRKQEFVARGGKLTRGKMSVPQGEPEAGNLQSVLKDAGYRGGEIDQIRAAHKAADSPESAQLSLSALKQSTRGKGPGRFKASSSVYFAMFCNSSSPLKQRSWYRHNNARGLARRFSDEREVTEAREHVEFMRAWCDEFLKNLPRTVSKAKV